MVFGVVFVMLTAAMPTGITEKRFGQGVKVLSGEFGNLGRSLKQDTTAKLQELCSPSDESCLVFRSESSFGLHAPGRRLLCRVTYRCPDQRTRSVAATREKVILPRCGSETPKINEVTLPMVELQPPPYAPLAAGN